MEQAAQQGQGPQQGLGEGAQHVRGALLGQQVQQERAPQQVPPIALQWGQALQWMEGSGVRQSHTAAGTTQGHDGTEVKVNEWDNFLPC